MKNYLLCIALLFLFVTRLYAQKEVVIRGVIKNKMSDSVCVTFNDNRIAYYPKNFYATIDEKGKFSISFPVPEGVFTQIELKHGDKLAELIVQPKDTLVMTVNTHQFDSTIHFSGKYGAISNFVVLHTFQMGRMNQYSLRLKEAMTKDPAGFTKAIDDELKTEMDFLRLHKKNLPASFVQYWSLFFQYYNYFFMQQYPLVHEMLRLRHYTDTIPEKNYEVMKDCPVAFNDSLLQLPPYLLYLTGIFETKLRAAGYTFYAKDTDKMHLFQDSVMTLVKTQMPPKSAEYYMAQSLYARIRLQPIEQIKLQYNDFKKNWSISKDYLPLFDKQIATAERLSPGMPAPDFMIRTQDAKEMKLSSLRGKVVYLEFWSAWCKQCVAEMLRQQKIKDLFKKQPVEFVYVSIGNDTTAESEVTRKYKIEGTFCDVQGEWNAPEVQLYGVQSLPAYFLIDTKGNFALRTVPPPTQSTQLTLEIGKLLK